MRVYFSPIIWDKEITYTFEGQKITVSAEGMVEEYDFSDLPDGKLEQGMVETPFSFQPIVDAEKVEGVLYVTLLNPIGESATEFERFPEWIEVGEENGEV